MPEMLIEWYPDLHSYSLSYSEHIFDSNPLLLLLSLHGNTLINYLLFDQRGFLHLKNEEKHFLVHLRSFHFHIRSDNQ